ncbi:primary-amine oxidase [Pseudonocardia sp. CA-107938]|uniref:primary-amine oxidase n=1 Tax=Pseudonocardia sp. CA-107938 TaxID=3240021 RepID=UPI003D8E87F1
MSVLAPQPTGTAPVHPTDPLTVAELAAVVAVVRASGVGPNTRFWGATIDEEHARTAAAGDPRRVEVVWLDPDAGSAGRDLIELSATGGALIGRTPLGVRNPGMTSEEARTAAAACRADPAFRAALARRGITDLSLVMIDPESIGGFEPPQYAGRRLTWGSVWLKTSPDDNGYARPVQGVVPIIDMVTMTVLEVEEHGVVEVETESGDYTGAGLTPRADLRPLDIVQPEGPSFTVAGHEIRWQNWTVRIGFTHREGLVLHDLTYAGRPVVRRASLNEMYVPYFDTSATQYRKNFFDWGEYGGGPLTNSLELGCDCLGVIHYFDVAVLGGDGVPRLLPNAICLHEEDNGIAWKHHDGRRGTTQVRRARRLVISTFVTVANYDYGFYWSLHQDGSLDLEIKMTGILSATGIAEGTDPAYGRRVSPRVSVPNHQHHFAVRLDMAVDGPRNRLVEVSAEPETDPALDPYGNAVRTVLTPIRSEADAARSADPSRAVHWRVQSADRRNRNGEPTAYRLLIDGTARLPVRPDSVCARRAPFVGRRLWATAHDPARRFVAGEYPNQAEPGADGVHVWQREDRPLDGAELVLWATVGAHHFPRPEDWPVMPVARTGLRLEPDGFFDRNPALDLPAPGRPSTEDDAPCH